MRLPRFSKKLTALGAVLGISLGTGGIAAAYFSTTGTGTGHAKVGISTVFTVTQTGAPSGDLYPAGTAKTVTFKIHNTLAGTEHYTVAAADAHIVKCSSTTPTTTGTSTCAGATSTKATHTTLIVTNTTASATKGKAIVGCKATWFAATATAKAGTLTKTAGGSSTTSTTDVVTASMYNGKTDGVVATTQDSCEAKFPKVRLKFTS